jgi:hypothetical protein
MGMPITLGFECQSTIPWLGGEEIDKGLAAYPPSWLEKTDMAADGSVINTGP